jgi:hypothetical protein
MAKAKRPKAEDPSHPPPPRYELWHTGDGRVGLSLGMGEAPGRDDHRSTYFTAGQLRRFAASLLSAAAKVDSGLTKPEPPTGAAPTCGIARLDPPPNRM